MPKTSPSAHRRRLWLCSTLAMIALISPSAHAQQKTASFSDVPPDHFAYDAVEYLKEKNILSGYDDGTFKPWKKVNRAEALKVIATPFITSAELAAFTTTDFNDVPAGAWYIPYLGWARKHGGVIVGPPKAPAFRPGAPITKAEFIKIFLASRQVDPRAFGDIAIPLSSDVTDTKQWYFPYMRYAIASSMTAASTQGLYAPNREITRSDVALLLHRFFLYRAGQRTQDLLSEAKKEVDAVINALSKGDARAADYASARGVLVTRGAREIRPEEPVVKVAVKIAEGCRALVRAYKAGQANDLKTVIKLSGDAWYLADQAQKISPTAAGIATQLKEYAKSYADDARKNM